MASRTTHRTNKSKPARGNGFPAQRNGRGVARYYLLYEHLSGALNDGTIPAGAALPSEPDLVIRYKLSRTTVRRALARLEEEGRIVRRRGHRGSNDTGHHTNPDNPCAKPCFSLHIPPLSITATQYTIRYTDLQYPIFP